MLVERPASGDLSIRWQAQTAGAGGTFRLYAGVSRENLRLIGELPAGLGPGAHRLQAVGPTLDEYVFELRFVHPNGTEEILRTALVRHRELHSSTIPIATSAPASNAILNRATAPAVLAPYVGLILARSNSRHLAGAEPETPPPRA